MIFKDAKLESILTKIVKSGSVLIRDAILISILYKEAELGLNMTKDAKLKSILLKDAKQCLLCLIATDAKLHHYPTHFPLHHLHYLIA